MLVVLGTSGIASTTRYFSSTGVGAAALLLARVCAFWGALGELEVRCMVVYGRCMVGKTGRYTYTIGAPIYYILSVSTIYL